MFTANKLKDLKLMMRVRRNKMVLINSIKAFFKKQITLIRFFFNFSARDQLASLKSRLDEMEHESFPLNKMGQEIANLLKIFPSKNLKRKWVGAQYRLGLLKPTYPEVRVLKGLQKAALEWKQTQEHISHAKLTIFELDQIHSVAEYTEFANLVLESNSLRNTLFEWALRDENEIAPFVEFPHTTELLIESNLSHRIGRMGAKGLKISSRKTLTLLIEGREENILDLNRIITFKGDLKLSVRKIFEIFKNKKYEGGILEYMQEGIINYSPLEIAEYVDGEIKPIDVNKKAWWKLLPVFETITKEEAIDRYNVLPENNQWITAATSTRASLNLDFNNTHAFLEIAIPVDDNHYQIFDFGKFAARFPKTVFETLKMFCENAIATIAYPDENVYYTFRERAYHAFVISNDEGERLMDSIRNDINTSRKKNVVYQVETENCAAWVESKLSNIIGNWNMPHLFWMPLLETEPNGLVKLIFKFIKILPRSIQVPVLSAIHVPLGAFQETLVQEEGKWVKKSLQSHSFFDHGNIYLPALLNKKKREEIEREELALERASWKAIVPVEYGIKAIVNISISKIVRIVHHIFQRRRRRPVLIT